MSLSEESDALHARVRAFARASLSRAPAESFDGLAADIARFQEAYSPGFRRLVEAHARPLADAASIPAVPVDAFRLARVAVHPPKEDAARFVTSGTTGGARGTHAMRTTSTYRELSLAWGLPGLGCDPARRHVVVALAPDPGAQIESSLAYMMRAFMEALDGRSLRDARADHFQDDVRERWLVGSDGADVRGIARAVAIAKERREPLVVLATSFALALFVEGNGVRFDAPEGSVVMTTGGFKGKTREVDASVLGAQVAAAFGVAEARIVGEYGMTELTSQLYERAALAPRGVFFPPPWLRVTAVDPETLSPVQKGEAGIARFVDLGNVDSAVAIVTQDVVREIGEGVMLMGRRAGAEARGCSLAIEEMVLGGGRG
ncbi:MAG TPA: acyl-protein synthetase [Polyangiaceae bacterium]|nr:acyl-protein synthetase [Polyangiaceae bacterium]